MNNYAWKYKTKWTELDGYYGNYNIRIGFYVNYTGYYGNRRVICFENYIYWRIIKSNSL